MSRSRSPTPSGDHTGHKHYSPSTHPSVETDLAKPASPPQPESSQPESSQPESPQLESSQPESSQPESSQPESSADVSTSTSQSQPEDEIAENANAEQPAESHTQGDSDDERDESFRNLQKQNKETRQELIAHIVNFHRRRIEEQQRRERFERARSFEDDDEWITEAPGGWVYTPATRIAPVSTNEVPSRAPAIPFARPAWRERYIE